MGGGDAYEVGGEGYDDGIDDCELLARCRRTGMLYVGCTPEADDDSDWTEEDARAG